MRIPIGFKLALVSGVCAVVFGAASPALAVGASPHLALHVQQLPTKFSAADNAACEFNREFEEVPFPPCDAYELTVSNLGARAASGPIVISDTLPAGVNAFEPVRFYWAKELVYRPSSESGSGLPLEGLCRAEGSPVTVTCELPAERGQLSPGQRLHMFIHVSVEPGALSAENRASVSEAGVPVASVSEDDVVNSLAVVPFGASGFLADITAPDGAPDTQAGDHPSGLTTRIDVNTIMQLNPESVQVEPTSVAGVRDVVVDLPLGFLGSATATPRCTFGQLQSAPESCPRDTMVGHIATQPAGVTQTYGAVYNMVPEHGVAAEFGFRDLLFHTHVIDANLAPTPAGYVVRARAREIPDIGLTNVITPFYGDPAAKQQELAGLEGKEVGAITPLAQFTTPSDCSGRPLVSSVYLDSWVHPGAFFADGTPNVEGAGWAKASSESPPVRGCNALRFNASMSAQPDTTAADSPTGLTFELKVPQNEEPGKLATPPLRDATVAMPPGMTVDPSSANGLAACSESQVGFLGWGGPGSPGEVGHSAPDFTEAPPTCPEASKVGEVQVTTPLLEKPVVGAVYLAAQDENPFGALLAAYIVIDDPVTGTIVKVPGKLETNPATGQITGVFDENPQLPFNEFKLRFFGGSRGELATPQSCGTFTTNSDLMPWSAPESGPDATPSDSFNITSNCSFGFSPSFSAGTTNNQAAAFTPFTLTIARQDGEQHLTGLTVTTPPGLLGVLKSVVQCGEPQAAQGKCGPESQIGETTISSGVGPEPFVVKGGRVYLTGPYNNGPFGLSIVVPAVAGPFNLGNVVVRSSIRINPVTAQVTVVSDPLPLMVNSIEGLKSGIPADTRIVNVTINRPGFEFNPTNCSPMSVTGTLTGAQGTTVPVSNSFQAANCATLPFHPSFEASTEGKASKTNGAAFIVKVTAKPGEANIAKTDLTLPLQLPSRLTTIQKACIDAIFEANPAACDEGSVIGTATVHSPDLKSPLTGPAYLVSHGGAAFPDVEFVLQGEGITLILDGKTDIKKGITYSKFETVPDAPIESFETILPTGPHSALGTNLPHGSYNLCGQKLLLPTTLVGQNGTTINETTHITIKNCKPAKPLTRAQKLAAALKACHKKPKAKRAACIRTAHKQYGPPAKKTANKRNRKNG